MSPKFFIFIFSDTLCIIFQILIVYGNHLLHYIWTVRQKTMWTVVVCVCFCKYHLQLGSLQMSLELKWLLWFGKRKPKIGFAREWLRKLFLWRNSDGSNETLCFSHFHFKLKHLELSVSILFEKSPTIRLQKQGQHNEVIISQQIGNCAIKTKMELLNFQTFINRQRIYVSSWKMCIQNCEKSPIPPVLPLLFTVWLFMK